MTLELECPPDEEVWDLFFAGVEGLLCVPPMKTEGSAFVELGFSEELSSISLRASSARSGCKATRVRKVNRVS